MKLMDRLVIRQSKEPEDNKTHILWHDSKSFKRMGFKKIIQRNISRVFRRKRKGEHQMYKVKRIISFRLLEKITQ